MRFSLSALTSNGASSTQLAASLFITTAVSRIATVPSHSLGTATISWLLVYLYAFSQGSLRDNLSNDSRRKRCWAAGACLAFSQICARASGEGRDLWWPWAFLPSVLVLLRWLDFEGRPPLTNDFDKPLDAWSGAFQGSKRLLTILTISSFIVLLQPFATSTSIALGFCSILFVSVAYLLLQEILISTEHHHSSQGNLLAANGSVSRKRSTSVSGDVFIGSIREVAVTAAIASGLATLFFESLRFDSVRFSPHLESFQGQNWRNGQWMLVFAQGVCAALVGGVQNILIMARVRNQGSLPLALVELSATLSANLIRSSTIFVGYFTALSISSIYFFTLDISPNSTSPIDRKSTRARQFFSIISVLSVVIWTLLWLRDLRPGYSTLVPPPLPTGLGPEKQHDPIPAPSDSASHPVYQLVNHAETHFEAVKSAQSKTLEEAVNEYKKRYGLSPPPNFDKWFVFAKSKNVQLIDEYDHVFNSILPFWGLDPATIRARTREALGFDNALIALAIREGEARKIEGGQEWQQQATVGMMGSFIKHLPDMDLAFNIHDEPRVVIPNEDLNQLIKLAKESAIPAASAAQHPKNAWSPKPADLNNGKSFAEVKTTRFNVFAHQPTWTHSRASCPATSPARSLSEHASDNQTAYAMTPLGFVYNATAFSDICNSPSFSQTFGFFDRPNAFNIVHDLFPIFSQSKTSSFQDILYPSPWYWAGKVSYDPAREVPWSEKTNKLYWRGSTTGGFSRNGGWRRQHRQRIVRLANAHDNIKIMTQPSSRQPWTPKTTPRSQFADLFDIHFSHVGQCDPGDCEAQRAAFTIAPTADQQDAWKYKHLLDMDGNAFSGRFYAFLKSKSLVYKMAVFREWHLEWLRPWVHYVPLSLRADEWTETVRWFADEGKEEAQRVAEAGRDWAEKVLRKEDFEVYFFRLLLEYGRVIDDNRAVIGYGGP